MIEIYNEGTLYVACLSNSTFLLESQNELLMNNLKNSISWILIGMFLLNFIMNIAIIGTAVIKELFQTAQDFRRYLLEKRAEEKRFITKNLLIESLGSENVPNLHLQFEEFEAIKFCKSYVLERNWCKDHDLDLSELEDEKTFLGYLDTFHFRKRRDLVSRQDII